MAKYKELCKNCKYFRPHQDSSVEKDFLYGFCNREADDLEAMESNQFSIMCGHDGPVFVGSEFGCIFFEREEK